ncbi:PaaI family thioesterase [Corynebacterium urogenitale]
MSFLNKAPDVLANARSSFRKLPSTLTARAMENPKRLKRFTNLWPPLWGAGIQITDISDDWRRARLQLNLHVWSANMHNAAFGGALYSMTDFLFGTLAARVLGRDFEVWTRTGTFQYISPGRDGAYLEVEFTPEHEAWVRETVAEDGYCNVAYTCVVKNADGSVVGIGQQDMHVRPRGGGKRSERPKQAMRPRGLVLEAMATTLIWHVFKDQPEVLTILMSEQRRIPHPKDQMKHVCKAVLEKSDKTREDLLALDIPEEYLP